MTKLVIRTHASPDVGFGHLNRCLILAEALRQYGCDVDVYVNSHPSIQEFIKTLKIHYLAASNIDDLPQADACVVDMYCYDSEYYKELRKKYKKIIIFDDDELDIPEGVSAIINGNIYAKKNNYPKTIFCFAGIKYFLLRTEFLGKQKSPHAKNIFVCTGGSDPENQTTRILSLLSKVTVRQIDVVYGPGFDNESIMSEWSSHPQIKSHYAIDNISELMQDAAYCVTGAGSIMYELGYMGVPVACLGLAKHQRIIAEHFERKEAVVNLGDYSKASDLDIMKNLKIMDADANMRMKLGRNIKQLIDGKGSKRLACDLTKWINDDN